MCTVYKDQDFISEFIEIYRSLPCLWKKSNLQYHNTNERDAAYKILLEKFQQYEPTATIDSVKSKINNLRTVYNKEFKKVKQYESKGELYSPTLWYYDLMSFLDEQLITRRTYNNNNNNTIDRYDIENIDDSNSLIETDELKREEPTESAGLESTTYQDFTSISNNDNKKRTNKHPSNNNANKRLRSERLFDCTPIDGSDSIDNSRYVAFGNYVTEELNHMPVEMVPFVKKLINDALFEGHMRSLNRTSTIRTQYQ